MTLTNRQGREIPFFVTDATYEDIQTADFDPITTLRDGKDLATDMNDSRLGCYEAAGFLVKPDTAGVLYAITWEQYSKAISAGQTYAQRLVVLAALVPQAHIGVAGSWIECPMVKVFAQDDGDYASLASYINVALV